MTSLDVNVREFQYNQCMLPSRDSLGKIAWVRLDFLTQGKISDICIRCARNTLPVTGLGASCRNLQLNIDSTKIIPLNYH